MGQRRRGEAAAERLLTSIVGALAVSIISVKVRPVCARLLRSVIDSGGCIEDDLIVGEGRAVGVGTG